MSFTEITIPASTNYLSDFVQSFPDNCLLYKGKLGCGGTTLALTNSEHYIVAVPFVSLIENKAHSLNHICPVAGQKSKWKPQVAQYLQDTTRPCKFICTYVALENLALTIEENGGSRSDFKLLVDEYHLLFLHYAFRSKAIKAVLANFSKFKAFCFLTATPLQDDYVLEELKHLPVISYNWEQTDIVTVKSVYCTASVEKSTIALVQNHLVGTISGNAHIFVNSLAFMNRIIEYCDLTEDNAKIVYSKNNAADMLLPRGESFTPPCKINFYSASAYEGVDIMDCEGKIYIISDPSKEHTLVDIATSLNQICGRIRNTQYWSQIVHLYRTTRYSGFTSFEDFKADTERIIEQADHVVSQVNNNLDESTRSQLDCKNLYVAKEDNLFFYDPNLLKVDMFNYNVTKNLYRLQVNVRDELRAVGFTVLQDEDNSDYDVLLNPKPSLKETLLDLSEIYQPNAELIPAIALQAFQRYDFLKSAIDQFGYEFLIFNCKGIAANIKRNLIKNSHRTVEDKVRQIIHTRLQEGQFIEIKVVKDLLDKTYKSLGLEKKAKATDLKQYFMLKRTTSKVKDKVVNGFALTKKI